MLVLGLSCNLMKDLLFRKEPELHADTEEHNKSNTILVANSNDAIVLETPVARENLDLLPCQTAAAMVNRYDNSTLL